jgi:hypothetical protein
MTLIAVPAAIAMDEPKRIASLPRGFVHHKGRYHLPP